MTVFNVALGSILVPTLGVHHPDDQWPYTPFLSGDPTFPNDPSDLVSGLTGARDLRVAAPRVAALRGGAPPAGIVCGSMHNHGFVGLEAAAMSRIGV